MHTFMFGQFPSRCGAVSLLQTFGAATLDLAWLAGAKHSDAGHGFAAAGPFVAGSGSASLYLEQFGVSVSPALAASPKMASSGLPASKPFQRGPGLMSARPLIAALVLRKGLLALPGLVLSQLSLQALFALNHALPHRTWFESQLDLPLLGLA